MLQLPVGFQSCHSVCQLTRNQTTIRILRRDHVDLLTTGCEPTECHCFQLSVRFIHKWLCWIEHSLLKQSSHLWTHSCHCCVVVRTHQIGCLLQATGLHLTETTFRVSLMVHQLGDSICFIIRHITLNCFPLLLIICRTITSVNNLTICIEHIVTNSPTT